MVSQLPLTIAEARSMPLSKGRSSSYSRSLRLLFSTVNKILQRFLHQTAMFDGPGTLVFIYARTLPEYHHHLVKIFSDSAHFV